MADTDLPAAGKHPVTFLFPALGPKKDGAPAAGLFVLWNAIPLDTKLDADPATFKLGFCARDGTLFDVTGLDNPWPIALRSGANVGSRLGARVEQWSPQEYDVVFVAHPSPVLARELLEKLKLGQAPDGSTPADRRKAWRMQKVTPSSLKKNLVVQLQANPELFMPGGPPQYGGWLLYRQMPYQTQSLVMAEVRKLVFHLSRVRYPAACFAPVAKRHVPFVVDATQHGGVFDPVVQACLHRFQRHLAAGQAFQLSPIGIARRAEATEELQSWAFLHGADVAQPPIATDPGVVDAATAKALEAWFSAGLRKPGALPVMRGTLWARPELWWSFVALDGICQEFSAPYRLSPGNTFRVLPSSGPGQIETSFHKLGQAVDLDAFLGEPSDAQPLGIEGDWVKRDQLDWLLYIHSREASGVSSSEPVELAGKSITDTRAFLTQRLGPTLTPEAEAFLALLTAYIEKLRATPNDQLHKDYFRDTISRFQWQSGEADGGNAQTAITASRDAERNKKAAGATSWVNVSRHAFFVGLHRIGAHESKLDTSDDIVKTKTRTITPGSRKTPTPKAMELDDLSESIRRAVEVSLASITVTTPGKKTITLTPADFNLSAVSSWVARATDSPDVLAPPAPGMSFAPNGVDLTMEVPFPPNGLVDRFLQQRASIPIKVLKVGDGLKFNVDVADAATVQGVLTALPGAEAVPGKKDHSLVLRPVWATALVDEGDPGSFTYTVPLLAAAKELEWWHLELLPTKAGTFWHDLADDFGLDQQVLAAGEPDIKTAGPIFVGGAGMSRSKRPLSVQRTEPKNQVTSLERPNV